MIRVYQAKKCNKGVCYDKIVKEVLKRQLKFCSEKNSEL